MYVARKSVEEARLQVTGLETCRKVAAKVSHCAVTEQFAGNEAEGVQQELLQHCLQAKDVAVTICHNSPLNTTHPQGEDSCAT